MSRIKPGDSVNIMTCEHGFLMFGGLPYIEMVKTIKEEIERRTGAYDIRTKVSYVPILPVRATKSLTSTN